MIQESSLQPLLLKSLPVAMPHPYLIVPCSRSRFHQKNSLIALIRLSGDALECR